MKLLPDFEGFCALAAKGNLVPLRLEFLADLETPVSAFAKLTRGFKEPHSFLFESVEGGERIARYSYLGFAPHTVLSTTGKRVEISQGRKTFRRAMAKDPVQELESQLSGLKPSCPEGLPPFWGGAVGYFSYDCVRFFENIGDRLKDSLGFPESLHYLTDLVVAFDHVEHKLKIIAAARLRGGESKLELKKIYNQAGKRAEGALKRLQGPLPKGWMKAAKGPQDKAWTSNTSQKEFEEAVAKAMEFIRAGDIFQIQVGRRLSKRSKAHPFAIYRRLRALNPSPYMFYFQHGDSAIVGASPEIHLVAEKGKVSIRPIAGTRRRGRDVADEARMEEDLKSDPKERAEHIMLVDLARNDLGRVSKGGSVKVNELMIIERYSHVMHLVSDVTGELKDGATAFDAFRASLPAGTVTGAPKIRSMQIIEDLEKVRRGPYGGALGFVSYSGDLNQALVIRTLYITGGKVAAHASAGIVADSRPDLEWKETENKLGSAVRAVELAEEDLKWPAS